jgi:hypothetical protein
MSVAVLWWLQVFETEADLQAYMRDTDTVPYACSLDYYQSGEDEVSNAFTLMHIARPIWLASVRACDGSPT